tara:strand:- start:174 stop:839 length:666 start_codon:yes stop_codon:yes gene_type:complete
MSQGWVKLHRQLLDWEWYNDVNTSRLFIHLMLKANHKDAKWRGIDIKRGSRLTSIDKLSAETNLSVSKIRTAIKKLISTNDIASKSHSQHTVFTMINYDCYQGDDKQNDKPMTNGSQTDDKPIATNKKDKNDNNENNKDLSLINDGFAHWWNLYPVERRKNKGGCLTKFKSKCKALENDGIVLLINEIANDIDQRVKKAEDIKFIPMSETYLNQERWKDGE